MRRLPISKRRGCPERFDELASHSLVLYIEALHRVPPLRWMEAYRGEARELLRVDNLEVACQTIAAGGGIAVLPCVIADAVPELRRVFRRARGGQLGLGRLSRERARHVAGPLTPGA